MKKIFKFLGVLLLILLLTGCSSSIITGEDDLANLLGKTFSNEDELFDYIANEYAIPDSYDDLGDLSSFGMPNDQIISTSTSYGSDKGVYSISLEVGKGVSLKEPFSEFTDQYNILGISPGMSYEEAYSLAEKLGEPVEPEKYGTSEFLVSNFPGIDDVYLILFKNPSDVLRKVSITSNY